LKRLSSSSENGVVVQRDGVWGSLGGIAWFERRFSARFGFVQQGLKALAALKMLFGIRLWE
jgi:hypothetical protein